MYSVYVACLYFEKTPGDRISFTFRFTNYTFGYVTYSTCTE